MLWCRISVTTCTFFVVADCVESGCGGTWFMLDDDVESIFGSKEGFHVDIPHRVIVVG